MDFSLLKESIKNSRIKNVLLAADESYMLVCREFLGTSCIIKNVKLDNLDTFLYNKKHSDLIMFFPDKNPNINLFSFYACLLRLCRSGGFLFVFSKNSLVIDFVSWLAKEFSYFFDVVVSEDGVFGVKRI